MNAAIRRPEPEIEPCQLLPSAAAERRLHRRLGHERQFDEVLEASALYGTDPEALGELYDYWRYEFALAEQPLFRLPAFRLRSEHGSVRFWQVRSTREHALPLLLLHGGSASLAEFAGLAEALAEPDDEHGAAFHVVCPALDEVSRTQAAGSCAELMQRLGFSRYIVHGSDAGAGVALELAAEACAAVAGVHVTGVNAYPREAAGELATLSSEEKSQLALLTEQYERLSTEQPGNPLEELAYALMQLADSLGEPARFRDALLTGLSLRYASRDEPGREARHAELLLAPSCSSRAPLAVHCFPLGVPSLRRFVEAEHHVSEWHQHEHGGACPALEQPALLLRTLRDFAARLG